MYLTLIGINLMHKLILKKKSLVKLTQNKEIYFKLKKNG